MRCCDCEFRKGCKDEDTVLTAFVRCSIREEKLKHKLNQTEEYVKKSDLKSIGDVPWFDGRNGLNFDQHQTLVACCKAFREFVDQLPTADVVPKSEVEELTRENESLAKTVNEASELVRKLQSKVKKSKSEVEELEAERERQYEQAKADILANMADGGTSCHWCIDEHKAQAKAEVAREIFEEIEKEIKAALESNYKVLSQFEQSDELWYRVNGKIDALRGIDGFVEELKKKYIGVKEDDN